jgi:hypothetical protein
VILVEWIRRRPGDYCCAVVACVCVCVRALIRVFGYLNGDPVVSLSKNLGSSTKGGPPVEFSCECVVFLAEGSLYLDDYAIVCFEGVGSVRCSMTVVIQLAAGLC